jgi:hypothetical protein
MGSEYSRRSVRLSQRRHLIWLGLFASKNSLGILGWRWLQGFQLLVAAGTPLAGEVARLA